MGLSFQGAQDLFPTSRDRNVGISGQSEIPAGWIKDKEYKIIVSHAAFASKNPDVDDINRTGSKVSVSNGAVNFYAQIHLPHGAKILSAIVYGTADTEEWDLIRVPVATGGSELLAGAAIGTRDSTIVAGKDLIDNGTYAYVLVTDQLDAGEELWGGEVTIIFEDPEALD